jgi:hypothetical protein
MTTLTQGCQQHTSISINDIVQILHRTISAGYRLIRQLVAHYCHSETRLAPDGWPVSSQPAGAVQSGSKSDNEETSPMSLQTHLAELELRHQALESELADAQQHPSIDDLKIVELKRRKLHLKDEITRLRSEATSVH